MRSRVTGPSDAHARANRNPLRRYAAHLTGRPDPTIVQPMRLTAGALVAGLRPVPLRSGSLPTRRASATRTRAGSPIGPATTSPPRASSSSRPSNLESPTMKAFLEADAGFIRDIFWSDGMVRATGPRVQRPVESPCFKNATDEARTMSCFSCHTMHKTADDRARDRRVGRRSARAARARQRRVPAVPSRRSRP